MNLIRCPLCGEEYSPSYKTCPFCEEEGESTRRTRRAPRNRRHITTRRAAQSARGGLIAVLIVVLALLGWYIFGGKKPERPAAKPDAEQADATREPSSAADAGDASKASDDPFYDPNLGEADAAHADEQPAETPEEPPVDENVDVSGAALNRTDFTLSRAGETYRLKLSGTEATPRWSVDNPNVCTVTGDGTVIAIANGDTTVRCKVGTRELTCVVRVRGTGVTAEPSSKPQTAEPVTPPPAETTPTPAASTAPKASVENAKSINAGNLGMRTVYGKIPQDPNTKAFDVTLKPGSSLKLTVTNTDRTPDSWSSSDPAVATVDSSGKVDAVAVGATQISVKIGDATLVCIVRVKA